MGISCLAVQNVNNRLSRRRQTAICQFNAMADVGHTMAKKWQLGVEYQSEYSPVQISMQVVRADIGTICARAPNWISGIHLLTAVNGNYRWVKKTVLC